MKLEGIEVTFQNAVLGDLEQEVREGFTGKFLEPSEMNGELIAAAVEYVEWYIGTPRSNAFEFILQMWPAIVKNEKAGKPVTQQLSDKQAKGVLNCFLAAVRKSVQQELDQATQLADGTYTVGTRTFNLQTQPSEAEFAPGETIISYPGKRKPWIGFGFVRGTKVQAWSRFRDDPESQQMILAAQSLLTNHAQIGSVA